MTFLFLIGSILVLVFSFVVLFGAPFLPTLSNRKADALELLDLKPGQTLVELGSGDGRMLKMAAERGVKSIGYELNPLLVLYSSLRLWKYRHLTKVKWGNFWNKPLPKCDGIYVFLLDKYMAKLDNKIIKETSKPVKLVSFAFKVPGKVVARELNGMFLYSYSGQARNTKSAKNKPA